MVDVEFLKGAFCCLNAVSAGRQKVITRQISVNRYILEESESFSLF